ncbi:MAG: hypothetical protein ACKVQK_15195 [Burkholderiales bacterium]
MNEPRYDVVSPVGEAEPTTRQGKEKISAAPPLANLDRKKIGLLWTVFTHGDILLDALAIWIAQRYPSLQCVKLMPGRGLQWGDYPDLSLPELVREMGVDAVIVTAGG